MSFIPKAHEIYKHFKGNLYQIVAIAEHSETGEQLVIYQALYGDFKIYARPLGMFTGLVDHEKYPDVTQKFRFELQGPESSRQIEASEAGGQESEQPKRPESEPPEAGQAKRPEAEQLRAGQAKRPDVKQPEAASISAEGAAPETLDKEKPTEPPKATPQNGGMTEPQTEEELNLDPLVLEFLDADSYEQRLNILAGLHHRITDDMITTMAIACDVEVEEGDTETRYESLKTCLLTLEKYECNRLR